MTSAVPTSVGQCKPLPGVFIDKNCQPPTLSLTCHTTIDSNTKSPRLPSWSETQIHLLQSQVHSLRQDVIHQKKQALEKDRIIAIQQQKITGYIQRESELDELIKQFSNTVHVALETLQDKTPSSNLTEEFSDQSIDDLIPIICDM